ncbi:MAG: hypothetical protein J7K40_01025 [candidate division Zixibacteria bacterium]|nr:hypothetical protein [candidate division Zixibacteria bacterium]
MKKIALIGLLAITLLFAYCSDNSTEPADIDPISITSPENGDTISGTIDITAAAGSGYSFDRVDFYINGDSVGTDAASPYIYEWNTIIYTDTSQHDLTVIAYDGDDSYISDTVTVTTIPPIPIMITSPVDNANIYGLVKILTEVGEGYTFSRVDFYIDGDSVYSDTTSLYEYTWNTDSYDDSTYYSLHVKAYETDTTKTHLSATVTVRILRPLPITITAPVNNSTVSGSVNITAQAGSGYTFTRVDFYVDGDSVGTDASSPYTYSWDTSIYSDGSSHQLYVIGYTGTTNYTSPVVNVTVQSGQTGEFVLLSTIPITSGAKRVAAEGSHLYIAAGTGGMYAYDVSSPSSPQQIYMYNSPGDAKGIDTDSPYLVLADGDNGVQLFSIADPDTVVAGGTYNTSGTSWNVKIVGSNVYIADGNALEILTISGNTLSHAGRLTIGEGTVQDIDVVGSIAYVLDVNGLSVVNVSNPGSPSRYSHYTGFTGQCIAVYAMSGYVFAATNDEIVVLSTSSPSNLTEVASYSTQSGANGVYVANQIVYAAKGGSNGGALALDFSSGSSLTYIDQYTISQICNDITVSGGYVFLASLDKVDILGF